MDIEALWDNARKHTEILRMRLQDLATFESTRVPYIFLAESSVNIGDTVMRKGHVVIEHPSIVLPGFSPQLRGFDVERELQISGDALATFLLVRGIHLPSLKYQHQSSSLDLIEGSLRRAIDRVEDQLKRAEDTTTGLVIGPEEGWPLSIILLVGALVVRSADGDLRRILEAWRKRQRRSESG